MGLSRYICVALYLKSEHILFYTKFLTMNKSDSVKIAEGLSRNVKMPEFLDSLDKWNKVVVSIDSVKKFDDLALKLLEDDEVDVFQFHDILLKLAEDVKMLRPDDGEIITFIADTITEMLEFLVKTSTEKYMQILERHAKALMQKFFKDRAVCD